MSDTPTTNQPGWFPHPTQPSQELWWDGRAWTDHTRPAGPMAQQQEPVAAVRTTSRRQGVPVIAVVFIALGALVVGSVGGLIAGLAGGAIASSASSVTTAAVAAPGNGAAVTSTEAPTTAFAYSASTFTIKLKTASKQCFGSAGCNVTVQPVLSTFDPSSIPDTASGTLTYTITGDESGPIVETVDLTGSQYTAQESSLSTPSSSTKLTIKITDVQTNS